MNAFSFQLVLFNITLTNFVTLAVLCKLSKDIQLMSTAFIGHHSMNLSLHLVRLIVA
jgi:hypothetical protein